jgi:hypothetical protein
MPPRIIPILDRLRQDVAAGLSRETIEDACRQANHRRCRRILDPATTIYLFLLQVLHGNTACQHVVHFGGWTPRRCGSEKSRRGMLCAEIVSASPRRQSAGASVAGARTLNK